MEQVFPPSAGDLTPLYRSIGLGYSGHGDAVNDPARVAEKNLGPIPPGRWRMGGPRDHAGLGHYVIPLTPADGTMTHDRDGFYIHGDTKYRDRSASHGCIVMELRAREELGEGIDRGDVELEVLPE